MHILDHPQAEALLDDANLSTAAVETCAGQLETFVARYLPCFHRSEQRQHARTILRGKLTGLDRKTTEPIAAQAGQKRRPLQLFVGAGGWDDQAVLANCVSTSAPNLATARESLFSTPVPFPRRVRHPAAWPANGAAGSARWTTAKWAFSWPMRRRAAALCWKAACT